MCPPLFKWWYNFACQPIFGQTFNGDVCACMMGLFPIIWQSSRILQNNILYVYEYYGSCSQASLISRTKSDYFYQIRKRTGTNWLMRLESHGIQKGTHIYSFFNYIMSRLRRWCGNTFFYVAAPMYFLQAADNCDSNSLSRKFLFNINRGNFIGNRSIFMIQLQCIEHQVESTQDIKVFFSLLYPYPVLGNYKGVRKTPIVSFCSKQFKCL